MKTSLVAYKDSESNITLFTPVKSPFITFTSSDWRFAAADNENIFVKVPVKFVSTRREADAAVEELYQELPAEVVSSRRKMISILCGICCIFLFLVSAIAFDAGNSYITAISLILAVAQGVCSGVLNHGKL